MRNLTTMTWRLLAGVVFFGGMGCGVGFGQAPEWKWQNPLPTGNHLNDVQFIDAQTGWAVGANGTLLKTSNGGSSWSPQTSGTTNPLYSVHFTDAQTGWAVGDYGTILKTSNGGSSWSPQTSGTTNSLSSVHFTDAQTGWAVGILGTILKTSNGGSTWSTQTSGTSNVLHSVHFTGAQTGWAVGYGGTILKTSNGGNSWSPQTSGTTNLLFSAHFTDAQTGWAVGQSGTILKTSNGGNSWTPQTSGTPSSFYSVYFTDNQTGWAVGDYGTILKTSNGGSSWSPQPSGTSYWLSSVHFTDAQTGWAVGEAGTLLKTSNGGSTWSSQTSGTLNDLHSVHFTDAQTGWAVGGYGTILKTSNGGNSWSSQTSGTTKTLSSVHFTDALTGWAVGEAGTLLKTSNGGNSWSSQTSGTLTDLHSVHFADTQTGWAVGQSGTLLKTSNGGNSWSSQTSGTTNYLYSVHFTDAQTGWAVGTNGTLLKTSDGGNSWSPQTSGTANHLRSVRFTDAQTGWAVGDYGTILKTSNGGSSWTPQPNETSYWLSSVHFTDAQTGWAVGQSGTLLKTSNGGNSWSSQTSGTANYLYSVHFTDALTGWAVGINGTILTTITNNPIDPETPTSLIIGKLFEKSGATCNPSLMPVAGKLVKATPGPYYGISRNDGQYNLRVPLADTATPYTLQPVINSTAFLFQTVCPPSGLRQVVVDTLPDTLAGQEFGFEITPCHHLDVQLSSNRRRRCFVNTTSVSYINQGSLAAPDAYVLVEFPHWVQPLSASRPYVAVSDSVWRFELDTVSAGEWGSFTITDSVLCGNVGILNLSQCTKATIFPAPDCPPQSNWSGAEVSVSATCRNGFVELGLYNKTAVAMPDSVDYWVYLDSIQVKQAKVKLAAGDSLKLWVDAFGMPVYLTANQVAHHPSDVFVTTSVEACSDTVVYHPRVAATRFPIAQRPNSKTQCLPIIGAYDPNDKQAFPAGFTSQNVVAPGTRMEYLVRFQNSGNDTAFTVYVVDSLDNNLNPESLELGAASHPYEISMQTTRQGRTFLRFQFNNILLPDSNTNELKSHGFIQYRISPKAGLALGSQVRNEAAIYFDFNPPIYTNPTLTTFDNRVFTDTSLNDNVQVVLPTESRKSLKQLGVEVYPNPFTNSLHLKSASENLMRVSISDVLGKEVKSFQFIADGELSLVELPTGIYYLKFPELNRVMKVVKQ